MSQNFQAPLNPAQEKALVIILSLIQFTHVMDFVIMMPLGPQIMRAFTIDAQKFSFLVSAYTFAAAISGFLAALWVDRFPRKKALLWMYLGFGVGTFLCSLAPNYELLILARIIAGAFGGVAGSLVFTIIGDVVPMERRGRVTGTVMAAFSVSSVIGIPIGLALANAWDWHLPFSALGLISFPICIYAAKNMIAIPQSPHAPAQSLVQEWVKVMKESSHKRAFALTICLMFGAFSVIPFISPYMVYNVGIKESQLPLIYFFGGSFTFFTSRLFGSLSDKFGKHFMFYRLALISLLPILLVTHMPSWPIHWALVCTTLFMIFVSGRFVPAMALITSSGEASMRGGFMSMNSSIQQMASGCASLLAGVLVQSQPNGKLLHYNYVGYLALGATLLSLYLASRIQVASPNSSNPELLNH